jgi:hypothetical protein
MAHYPTEIAPQPHFLTSTDNLGERANASLQILQEHGFVVGVGMTEAFQPQVAAIAEEPAVVEYCPNDKKRVGTLEALHKWQSKGRGAVVVYATGEFDTSGMSPEDMQQLAEEGYLEAVAYGWSGAEPNKHIPGGDITTAYRGSLRATELARQRSEKGHPLRRMGLHLGELVLGTAVHHFGAKAAAITEENWTSNIPAVRLYTGEGGLGFVVREVGEPEYRPSTKRVGELVNGHKVTAKMNGEKMTKVVLDQRAYGQLVNHPLVEAA